MDRGAPLGATRSHVVAFLPLFSWEPLRFAMVQHFLFKQAIIAKLIRLAASPLQSVDVDVYVSSCDCSNSIHLLDLIS